MSANTATEDQGPARAPADMAVLDVLVGTWEVFGDATGQIRFEWLRGQQFLIQHVELEQDGEPIIGIEVIGHDRDFGQPPSDDIRSCFYDNNGNTFRYVYDVSGRAITIFAGGRDTGAFYTGELSSDRNTLTGSWTYPDGGGYESVARRVDGAGDA